MGWAGSYRHRKLGSYGECPTINRNHFSISEGGICTEIFPLHRPCSTLFHQHFQFVRDFSQSTINIAFRTFLVPLDTENDNMF